MNIDVKAARLPDGSARVLVECDGQKAVLLFDGREVVTSVPERKDRE